MSSQVEFNRRRFLQFSTAAIAAAAIGVSRIGSAKAEITPGKDARQVPWNPVFETTDGPLISNISWRTVNSSDAWKELWKEIMPSHPNDEFEVPPPAVNFAEQTIIVVGGKPTSGQAHLEVSSIVTDSSFTIATFRKVSDSSKGESTPLNIITIPKLRTFIGREKDLIVRVRE